MEKKLQLDDIDKDDPDYVVFYSSDSDDENLDLTQPDSFIDDNVTYNHFSYQDFNIPEQILPISGNDSECYGAATYTEISGIGFEYMKGTCDFFNSLIDQNDELQINDEQIMTTSGHKNKADQQAAKRNIIYPYAFYKKSKRRRPPKTRISLELQGSVGQANILAAQGNHKAAVELCLRLIESAPNSWEPLHTLAFVYKESGDQTKYLEYLLACAQIKKNDCQLWGQLGKEFFGLEHAEWAEACYERAIRCNILYIPLVWEWVCVNFKSGYILTAGNILLRFMRYVDVELYENIFHVIKLLIPLYITLKQESKLLSHLQYLIPHLYPNMNVHVIEAYLKLYVDNKNYLMIYNEVVHCFNIPLSMASFEVDNQLDINLCELLKKMEIDDELKRLMEILPILPSNILLLFVVSILHLFANNPYIVQFFMNIIMKAPKSDYSFKLVNVLYRQGYTNECFDYYVYTMSDHSPNNHHPTTVKNDHNIAFENDHFYGWLNIAECYWKSNNNKLTKTAHTIYVELADKLKYMHDLKTSKYHYIYLIVAVGHIKHANFQQAYNEIKCYLEQEITSNHNEHIVNFVTYLIDDIFRSHHHKIMSEETVDEEFVRSALILLWINHYDVTKIEQRIPVLLQSLGKMLWCVDNSQLIGAYGEKKKFLSLFHRHMNQILERLKLPILHSFREEICWRFISFCIQNKWYNLALSTVLKHMTTNSEPVQLLENNFVWNVFSLLLHKIKLNPYTRRMMNVALGHIAHVKLPLSERALLVAGHSKLLTNKNYRALEKYYLLCFYNPKEPNYFLYMAVTLANVAFRKHVDNYCSVALQSACVMQHYFKLKGGYASQEACYNLARCYHQMKMLHLAIPLYEKALEFNNSEDQLHGIIAYNLAHIYSQSGNYPMAKQLLRSYCSI